MTKEQTRCTQTGRGRATGQQPKKIEQDRAVHEDLSPGDQRKQKEKQRVIDLREMSDAGLNEQVDKLLSRLYYNPIRVGSLGGRDSLAQLVKQYMPLGRRTVELWLSTQQPYILHRRNLKRTFATNPIKVKRVGQIFQADLIFYKDIPHYGYYYLLLIQDTASRYIFYKFLKTKKCTEVVKRIKDIFREAKNIPEFFFCDRGSEFVCKEVKDYLKSVNCKMYHTGSSSHKTPNLDRAARQINERMAVYFTHKETTNWVQVVGKIISSQNRTVNRTTGMTPIDMWKKKVSIKQISNKRRRGVHRERPKFKVGQRVAMVGVDKGPPGMIHSYRGRITAETFEIIAVDRSQKRPMYTLRDDRGEVIEGKFYPEEIIRVRTPLMGEPDWKIDRIVGKPKTIKGVKYVLVKYKNLDKRYNEWIPESSLVDIPKVTIKRRRKN